MHERGLQAKDRPELHHRQSMCFGGLQFESLHMKRRVQILAMAAWGVAFQISTFGQGNLTPPGTPGPTMKTLTQIEPRTPINSVPFNLALPGSYYLVTNLTGVAAADG